MPRPKGSKNKNNKKPEKDKDAPKKGKSAFFYYVEAKRKDFETKFPDHKHSAIISEVSKVWKVLPSSEKEPFQKLAEEDRQRYYKQKEAYAEKHKDDKVASKDGKRKAEKKAGGEPKPGKKTKTVKYCWISFIMLL